MTALYATLVLLNSYLTLGFNFDTNNVIIYSDPYNALGVVKDKKSYFGYSTILYGGDNTTKPWVQIGAPRASDIDVPALNPGSVFRCNIGEPCDKIIIDSESGTKTYYEYSYIDNKNEAWIGSVMDIDVNLDRVIVCAFRWKNTVQYKTKLGDYAMLGSCYWARIHDLEFQKLLPLLDFTRYVKRIGRNKYYYYMHGQSGFSAHITNSHDQPELLLGAPSVFNWAGTTLIYKNLSEGYTSQAVIPKASFNSSGLYGYAVSSGYYFGKNELLYVGGSPKVNNYLGEISVYSIAKQSNKNVDVKVTKKGSQMGEYFGASLASGDINGDGYTDLLVGAPFYKASAYNEGRVHIFYGKQIVSHMFNIRFYQRTLVTSDELPVLTGKSPGGQFGTTIGYLGDINLDGFGDFAIAAPYENENTGNVYIYNGRKDGLNPEPSQIITGKSLCCNLKGFGISFSKATDIDNNKYDDLAIGSYLSGHVAILRGKPIVNLKQSLRVIGNNFNVNGTTVEICLWFEGSFLPKNISINRIIQVDERLRRVYLEMSNDTNKQEILKREEIYCKNYTMLTRENAQNFEQPVNIKITQKLSKTNTLKQPVIIGSNTTDAFCKTCPVLAPYEPLSIEVPFAVGCGDDNFCKSQLSFTANFEGTGLYKNQYVIGSGDNIKMTVDISNMRELAYTTKITVVLPKNIQLASTPKGCAERNSSVVVICDVANPLKTDERKLVALTLKMNDVPNTNDTVSIRVSVSTSSTNTNLENTKTYNFSLITQADLQLTGKSSQMYYSYGNKTSGASIFSQVYQIQKFGKTPIDKAVLYINIPTSINTSNGSKTFLKLLSHVGSLSGHAIICKNLTYVEYLKIDSAMPSNNDDQFSVNTSETHEPTESSLRLLKRSVENIENGSVVLKPLNSVHNTSSEEEDSRSHPVNSSKNINGSINNIGPVENTGNGTRSTTIEGGIENNETITSGFIKDSKIHLANSTSISRKDSNGFESTTSFNNHMTSEIIEDVLNSNGYSTGDHIDCNIVGVQCATIKCKVGPFVNEEHVGVVQIKALLDVSVLKEFIFKKDTLVLQTSGNITTGNFNQTGDRPDEATVDTIFNPDQSQEQVDSFVVVSSIFIGVLLLLFITLCLIKVGFFNRRQKEELQALKKAVAENELLPTEASSQEINTSNNENERTRILRM